TRVALVHDFVEGVINVGGVVTRVIDLRIRFNFAKKEFDDSTRIIIVHIDDLEVGLIVDGANDVIDVPLEIVEPAPEVVGSVNVDYIEGIAKMEKRLLILLDLYRILNVEEMDELTDVEG